MLSECALSDLVGLTHSRNKVDGNIFYKYRPWHDNCCFRGVTIARIIINCSDKFLEVLFGASLLSTVASARARNPAYIAPLTLHFQVSLCASFPKPIDRLSKMLPQFRPIGTILGTIFEELELIDGTRLVANVMITSRPLYCPFYQRPPVFALPQLSHPALRRLGTGRIARRVVGLAQDVSAQAVKAVRDMREREGLRHVELVLTDGTVDVLEAVQGMDATEEV